MAAEDVFRKKTEIKRNNQFVNEHKYPRLCKVDIWSLETPDRDLLIREIDEEHVAELKKHFQQLASTRVFTIAIRDNALWDAVCHRGWSGGITREALLSSSHKLEVLCGNHSLAALKLLAAEDPANPLWQVVDCNILVASRGAADAKELAYFAALDNIRQAKAKDIDFADLLVAIRGRVEAASDEHRKKALDEACVEFASAKGLRPSTVANYASITTWSDPAWKMVAALLKLKKKNGKPCVGSQYLFAPLSKLSDGLRLKHLQYLLEFNRAHPGMLPTGKAFRKHVNQEAVIALIRRGILEALVATGKDKVEAMGLPRRLSWSAVLETFPELEQQHNFTALVSEQGDKTELTSKVITSIKSFIQDLYSDVTGVSCSFFLFFFGLRNLCFCLWL